MNHLNRKLILDLLHTRYGETKCIPYGDIMDISRELGFTFRVVYWYAHTRKYIVVEKPIQDCPKCGGIIIAIKGSRLRVCARCGWKDDCC